MFIISDRKKQKYHPPYQSDYYFFENIDKTLDLYRYYDNMLLTGDFNTEI